MQPVNNSVAARLRQSPRTQLHPAHTCTHVRVWLVLGWYCGFMPSASVATGSLPRSLILPPQQQVANALRAAASYSLPTPAALREEQVSRLRLDGFSERRPNDPRPIRGNRTLDRSGGTDPCARPPGEARAEPLRRTICGHLSAHDDLS